MKPCARPRPFHARPGTGIVRPGSIGGEPFALLELRGRDRPAVGCGPGFWGERDAVQVGGHESSAAVGPFVPVVGAGVVGSRSGALVPVGPGLSGDGVADVGECAGDLGDDVVRAFLVAGDDDSGDPVVGDGSPVGAGLGENSAFLVSSGGRGRRSRCRWARGTCRRGGPAAARRGATGSGRRRVRSRGTNLPRAGRPAGRPDVPCRRRHVAGAC